jgi:nitrate reductase NapAB chaperone NapD
MKKAKPTTAGALSKSSKNAPALTEPPSIRYRGPEAAIPTVPCTIHAPVDGGVVMSDRAYILIDVLPGRTSDVVKALSDITQIKTIDPCWGKPDIIVVVEVQDQNALTQLVLRQIHAVDGVAHTDTHLVYRLKDSTTT